MRNQSVASHRLVEDGKDIWRSSGSGCPWALQGEQFHSLPGWAVGQWRCSFEVKTLPGALETQIGVPRLIWVQSCGPWVRRLFMAASPSHPCLAWGNCCQTSDKVSFLAKGTNLAVKLPGKCSETPRGLGWGLSAAELSVLPSLHPGVVPLFHLGLLGADLPCLFCAAFYF